VLTGTGSHGCGFTRVWVQVGVELPMGYPRHALALQPFFERPWVLVGVLGSFINKAELIRVILCHVSNVVIPSIFVPLSSNPLELLA